jgi:hypothetical protein
VGAALRGARGLPVADPGSFLALANAVAVGSGPRGDDWGTLWHAADKPWGGMEALDHLFEDGGLAPAGAGG